MTDTSDQDLSPSLQELMRTFGDNVRAQRMQRGLSQQVISADLHMDQSFFASIERGKRNLTFKTAQKIADGLDVDLLTLLTLAPELPNDKNKEGSPT
ncbi:helix-turn-helix domain-containing protein [Leucobacter luti]|nr:helix-turn-helix transcriptional regulator [Leucobacter luti]